ncbi:hypothetical protein [Georgenia yuyongxinii]|uniref:Uncharacterized protein n=1 Tax=Georgenia yuyongxinii TaxID=2589797 RepID=A0A552WU45_9MICO|nr:hypothetical protein [Georgenia yuyongxinii]TRW46371.1 hypothetical protein FJ693_05445 [Georgenia yuyongxinii]
MTAPDDVDLAAEAVGPVYFTADLVEWLGVGEAELEWRAAALKVLAIRTADALLVFPAWQFDEDGQVLPGVTETLRALATGGLDDFTHVLWFGGASDELDGLSAVEWLTQGRPVEPVVAAARKNAARWRR